MAHPAQDHPTTATPRTRPETAVDAEYKAYKQGYYSGKKKAVEEGQETRGFLIGSVLVLLFGLGALAAYLSLQKQPVNIISPTSPTQAPSEVEEPDRVESVQPNINVTITEPSSSGLPSSAVEPEPVDQGVPSSGSADVNEDAPTLTSPSVSPENEPNLPASSSEGAKVPQSSPSVDPPAQSTPSTGAEQVNEPVNDVAVP